jgi:hypothetical protein
MWERFLMEEVNVRRRMGVVEDQNQ